MTTLPIGEQRSGFLTGPDLPLLSYEAMEYVAYEFPKGIALIIRLWKGKRAGSKMESDLYEVERQMVEGQSDPEFLINNRWNPDPLNPGPYRCVLGNTYLCSCTAGNCKVVTGCKHRIVLSMILKELAHPEPATVSDPAQQWETRATPAVRFDTVGKPEPVPTVDEAVASRAGFDTLLERAGITWEIAVAILDGLLVDATPYGNRPRYRDIWPEHLRLLAKEVIARVYENIGV